MGTQIFLWSWTCPLDNSAPDLMSRTLWIWPPDFSTDRGANLAPPKRVVLEPIVYEFSGKLGFIYMYTYTDALTRCGAQCRKYVDYMTTAESMPRDAITEV